MFSLGAWMLASGSEKPEMMVGMPWSASAATIGSVPPERTSAGRTPSTRSNASWPSWIARASGGTIPGRAEDMRCTSSVAPRGVASDQLLERSRDGVGILSRRQPHRHVRDCSYRKHRLLEARGPRLDAVDVERRLSGGADVELLGGRGIGGVGTLLRELGGAPRQLLPVLELLRRWRNDALPQRLGQSPVGRDQPVQRPDQRMRGVQRRPAVDAGVQIGRAGRELEMEVNEPAGSDVEGRDVLADHPRVEDDRGVSAPLIGLEELDDRMAARLLLPVTGEAHVYRQRARLGERPGAGQQHEELALVIGDAAAVEAVLLDAGLERFRLPKVQWIRRLYVEVSVTEHRGRRVGIHAGPDLTHGQGLSVPVDQLAGSAGTADQIADPFAGADHVRRVLRVGADRWNAQKLREFVKPIAHEEQATRTARGSLTASYLDLRPAGRKSVPARVAAALRSRSSRSARVGQASTARLACFNNSPLSGPSSMTG